MPRVRYRAWTLYEEALGLANVKKVAWGGFGLLAFNIGIMMSMWGSFGGQSRHAQLTPEQNAKGSQFLEDRFSMLYDTLTGQSSEGKFNTGSKKSYGGVPR